MSFATITDFRNYVNTFIIPNGMNLITGQEANDSFNGAIDYIIKSMPNYNKVQIISTGGVVVLAQPMAFITGVNPASVQWPDDFMNEYYIVNALGAPVALASGFTYIDAFGAVQTTIPANTAIHIAKGINNSWLLVNNEGTGSGGTLPPQNGHAGQVLVTNGTSTSWTDLHITIKSGDFQPDGVTYLNPNIGPVFKVSIFSRDVPNFLYEEEGEWQYVSGGIEILVPWFNASTNPNLILELFFKGIGSAGSIPPAPVTYGSGNSTQSGTGLLTQFAIPHSLSSNPTYVNVIPGSADAVGSFYLTHDATNIYVNYSIAPQTGSGNLTFYWSANV